MLICIPAGLAYLAMPKTGTTALQAALRGHSQIIFTRAPDQIHLHAAYFERYLRPYLAAIGADEVETVCQIREPVSWLLSWWKYRRTEVKDSPEKSTLNVPFERFAEAYLAGEAQPWLDFGRPMGFLANDKGDVLVNSVFRYEEMDHFLDYLSARIGSPITTARRNVSPAADVAIDPKLRSCLEVYFAPEMDIWETGTVRDPRSHIQRFRDKTVKMLSNPFG